RPQPMIRPSVFQLPFLLFVSILAFGWEIFLILYFYDSLDKMVASIKQYSAKSKNVPKALRVVAWHILIPAASALIVSIAFHYTALLWISAFLLGIDA
ncbi:MAG: hypothetical protein IIX94_02170, partial [Clostridia bacterium]|nr:hypothetical protein [Clostridia bacterium]